MSSQMDFIFRPSAARPQIAFQLRRSRQAAAGQGGEMVKGKIIVFAIFG